MITPELIRIALGFPVTIAEVDGMPSVVPGKGADHQSIHTP
jgi:hypothetical protein